MRFFVLAAVLVCATLVVVAEARLSNWQEWQAYKQKYGKVYETPEEDTRRFALFLRSKARLAMLRGVGESHKRGLNHLSDLSEAELEQLNGFKLPAMGNSFLLADEHMQNTPEAEQFVANILSSADSSEPLPAEVDWRKVPGRVSAVKNQKQCGSCWAFSTTGLLEGQQVVAKGAAAAAAAAAAGNKTLVPLSEQDLVDCSAQDAGCNGGLMGYALQDIAKLGGIESEQDYPYEGHSYEVKPCRFVKSKSVMSDVGPAFLPQKQEDKMKQVVAKYGPVAVAIDAKDLFDYESGVYKGEKCTGNRDSLDHAVLVVGYGTDPKHGDYWIIKNSWSEKWGEKGYFRMSRGKNTCAIGLYAVIAKM